MIRLRRHALLFAAALQAAAAAPLAAAPAPARVLAGDPAGAHVSFAFAPRSAEPLVIETRRAGVAGSVLSVRVDRAREPAFRATLTEQTCAFDAEGSRCRLVLTADDPAVGRLEEAFRLGRVAHVAVATGGVMEMEREASLIGFTRALGAAR